MIVPFTQYSYLDPALTMRQIAIQLNSPMLFPPHTYLDPVDAMRHIEAALGQPVFSKAAYLDPVRALWDYEHFAAAWTPALMSNLVAWYDAQNTSSIILNGLTVSQWNDQSGHGYNAVQGTAAYQPTYNATGLNGYPALTFNGTNNYLQLSIPTGQFPTAVSCAYVVTANTVNFHGGLFSQVLSASPYNADPIYDESGGVYIGDGSTQAALGSAFPQTTTPVVFIRNYDRPSDALVESNNGTVVTNSQPAGATSYGSTGDQVRFGTAYGHPFTSGTYGEAIACAGVTTADRQKLEGYLAWKWGMQANLPAGHPYKGGPPYNVE
jgi:hypothetical protein